MPVAPLVSAPLVAETAPFRVKVWLPTASVPLVSVRPAPTVADAPRVTPAALLIVRPLNVVALLPPIDCAALPLKATVLVEPVNVPLFVQLARML